jgi:hypothetical protein
MSCIEFSKLVIENIAWDGTASTGLVVDLIVRIGLHRIAGHDPDQKTIPANLDTNHL